jgi:hypothetical protein
MRHLHKLLAFALVAIFAMVGFAAYARATDPPPRGKKIGYNQFIRPILSDNCFYCHGPDKNHRQAELRLDVFDAAVAKGAIVPGKPDESELVHRIMSDNKDSLMPPPDTHKSLTDAQKALLKTWIAQGAVYEPHWAYIAPVRPPLPAVKESKWIKNPVDAFILATLESKGLTPSPEADKRTLLRRLSLDLIGLPPTPEEISAFLADTSADAYEKQVDRLLASPHYGERMAVPWLDAVRFADTVGFHGDQNQNVFPYRDYVIDAFNKNKPFDQFTIEQLAGDLLPNPTEEQLTATCFNRLNMMTREGGAQPKEYIAKYQADRVRTVSGAWLGSTMGCCECHDHKYDPFKAKDFYSLSAYWADVKQWGVYADYGYTPNPDLRGYNNDFPFPPEAKVQSESLSRKMAKYESEIDRAAVKASEKLLPDATQRAAFEKWLADIKTYLARHPAGWDTLALDGATSKASPKSLPGKKGKKKSVAAVAVSLRQPGEKNTGALTKTLPDGSILFTGEAGETDQLEFKLEPGTIAAIRLEALPSDALGDRILRGQAAHTTVNLSAAIASSSGKPATQLRFSSAEADFKDDRYNSGRAILGISDGWITSAEHVKTAQQAVWNLDKPAVVHDGDKLLISLASNMLACIRVSISPVVTLKPVDPNFGPALTQALHATPANGEALHPAANPIVARTYLMTTHWDTAALAQLHSIYNKYLECTSGITPVLITGTWSPKVTRILPRGNWQDESGEIVEPHPPAFLPQLVGVQGKRQSRLDLARWIVAPENPLTSRAIANRLWKQFFGNGLSGNVEDLGAQGEWPSHPELLDWLAVEFRTSGWDVKHMVRLMVTSAAYRQDSNLRTNLAAVRDVDPSNRLLSSQNPRRLEAEFVRDNALVIAGLINLEIGGPSCKPYQPAGYYANIQFPDRRYVAEDDNEQYRRGLYMHWQRTFLHPMLANFDAPSREDGICTRNVSNTPQQALTLLNDPEFVEAAKALALHAMDHAQPDDARLEFIYQRTLARSIKPQEADSLKKFLAAQKTYFKTHPADAAKLLNIGIMRVPSNIDQPELAAWMSVCRVVLNLHETITRY